MPNFLKFSRKTSEEKEPPEEKEPSKEEIASTYSLANLSKRLINSDDIEIKDINIEPQISPYNLPLNTEEISNFEDISSKIEISDKAMSLFRKNGFVVIPTSENIQKSPDEFSGFYDGLKAKKIPIFITSDSLLHYYHIFFDTGLMKLEKNLFYDDIYRMSKKFFDESLVEYNNNSGDLKESAKKNVAYFSVALSLLAPQKDQVETKEAFRKNCCGHYYTQKEECDSIMEYIYRTKENPSSFKYFSELQYEKYKFETPDFVKDLVDKEIRLIRGHGGWDFSPIFIYKEDYSQYIPRGHYTKSEKLKNYFKSMMWYGRMTGLVNGSSLISQGKSICTGDMSGIVSEHDAKIQTLQSLLISQKFLKDSDIRKAWQRMYAITSFFVGFSDDLGPYEYSILLNDLLGEDISSKEIEKRYSEIKDELSRLPYNPEIYSGLGQCELFMPCPPLVKKNIDELKVQAKGLLKETKGFRLMGQRFTVDSWLFSEIVSPYSGEYSGERTLLPTLEKPFTFTWDDAYSSNVENRPFTWVKTDVKACPPPAMREVRGFPQGLDIMALFGSERAKQILKQSGNSNYSDYESKFALLKKQIDSLPKDDWFQNLYWNWLYTLKSLFPKFGDGYQTFMQTDAWQDKETNTALSSWAELRHDTILYVKQSYTMAETGGTGPGRAPIVGYVEPVPEFYSRLLALTKMTKNGLQDLVPKTELDKTGVIIPLNNFSEILSKLLEISKKELSNQPLTDQEYWFIEGFGASSDRLLEYLSTGEVDPDMLKTTLIADVHTEGNTKKVLEQGVGNIKTLIVAYKLPDGRILTGVGPVFSYYEFKQPMNDRLTDEKWREMLGSDNFPDTPKWTKSFSE